MKIGIVGTRGIPAKYGGFETFAEEVSPLLVRKGYQVTVYCDKSDISNPPVSYKDVSLSYLPITKTNSPLKYYFTSLWHALKSEDIILVTGTAGSLFYFLNIYFRKKIVTNTDGVESRRAKWTPFKKLIIKFTEYLAVKNSTHLIADSKAITKYLLDTYPKLKQTKVSTIEYGAYINNSFDQTILDKYNLVENDYYLVVSRLEPENNIKMIIDGYKLSNSSKSLTIVGNILSNDYSNLLLTEKTEKIKFLGGIYNPRELSVIRYCAFAYIHGHSVGGTNPSLLEALGSSNISICHDNVYNREVTNNQQIYFSQPIDFKNKTEELEQLSMESLIKLKGDAKARIKKYYTWENIANKYSTLFSKL